MTCIVLPADFPSKKSLKEHCDKGLDFTVEDPSIFAPFIGSAKKLAETQGSFTVTNHPKRSWFASVTLKDGKLKVS